MLGGVDIGLWFCESPSVAEVGEHLCLLGDWEVLPGFKRHLQKDFCSKTKRSQLWQGAMLRPGGALEHSGVEACGWSGPACQEGVMLFISDGNGGAIVM